MSFDFSGLDAEVKPAVVQIEISEKHPLILLANKLPWNKITEIVLYDLKNSTSKLKWWLGRKLNF